MTSGSAKRDEANPDIFLDVPVSLGLDGSDVGISLGSDDLVDVDVKKREEANPDIFFAYDTYTVNKRQELNLGIPVTISVPLPDVDVKKRGEANPDFSLEVNPDVFFGDDEDDVDVGVDDNDVYIDGGDFGEKKREKAISK